jgi:hypothetical protein
MSVNFDGNGALRSGVSYGDSSCGNPGSGAPGGKIFPLRIRIGLSGSSGSTIGNGGLAFYSGGNPMIPSPSKS